MLLQGVLQHKGPQKLGGANLDVGTTPTSSRSTKTLAAPAVGPLTFFVAARARHWYARNARRCGPDESDMTDREASNVENPNAGWPGSACGVSRFGRGVDGKRCQQPHVPRLLA